MRFNVKGADKESGADVKITLVAPNQKAAEQQAHDRGILVEILAPEPEAEKDAIALIDDPPADEATTTGAGPDGAPHHDHASHGTISLSANAPSEAGRTSDGSIPNKIEVEAAMEYHVVMNQAVYLLEVAVNKYIKDGWEPQGSLTIGYFNNSPQYFQALVRKKKTLKA